MHKSLRNHRFLVVSFLSVVAILFGLFTSSRVAEAQQTLGGITGTVTDISDGVLAGATVSLVSDETKLTRTQTTNSNGAYSFVNLPIGRYTLTFTQPGFETQTFRPSCPYQKLSWPTVAKLVVLQAS